ncbi:glycosyltransferase [Kribbella antibiotica]|uniref:Glycosyltransferase n=1 Tax=Kribbella antibiotica TaxID=190195 RepID=A0A4V2YPF1_9ACTN|nr:glycosyltransferase [Kribbella antibiotica]TDD57977.1 glycosyltransferase [Kribbella antibiotica]
MRFVLLTWGSRGDVEPLAGLARKLQEYGAEAVLCAPPDEEFRALAARAGVELVPVGRSVQSVVNNPKPPSREAALKLAPELVAARFDVLPKVAEGAEAIVATGLMPAGARDVAEKLGIRYEFASFHTLGMPPEGTNALYLEALNTQRAAIGLPPIDDVRAYVRGDQPWLASDPTLWPADIPEVLQLGAWTLPDDRPLPADLEAFLDAGEPPVYVGFGSMASHAPKDIARLTTEAARAHGRRVLLNRGWADIAAIDDQKDTLVIGEVNQQALFPRVATVIHHGGAGTTTTAAKAGTPQLVVPRIVDQPRWAARVAELGIGFAHQDPDPTLESLTSALTTTLASETRARAQALAPTINTDGTTRAAELLLSGAVRER